MLDYSVVFCTRVKATRDTYLCASVVSIYNVFFAYSFYTSSKAPAPTQAVRAIGHPHAGGKAPTQHRGLER